LWDLQFFFNLLTCAEGHENPCNAILGVAPPTVEEYLFAANHNLLIPFIATEGENDNFGEEGDRARFVLPYNLAMLSLFKTFLSIS
jgi:hypothetical protein